MGKCESPEIVDAVIASLGSGSVLNLGQPLHLIESNRAHDDLSKRHFRYAPKVNAKSCSRTILCTDREKKQTRVQ
jgi:hypothetical protein